MNQAPTENSNRLTKSTFVESLNIVGSIASITGISLLWIKDLTGKIDWEVVLLVALVAPALLGLLSGLVWLLMLGYQNRIKNYSAFAKMAYFGIGGPLVIVICFLVAIFTNKLFISVNWIWFFSQQSPLIK